MYPITRTRKKKRPRYTNETIHSHPTATAHSDQFIMAQSGRALVCRDHPQKNSPGYLPKRSRPDEIDPGLYTHLQRESTAFSMGRQRQPYHPKSQSLSTNFSRGGLEIGNRIARQPFSRLVSPASSIAADAIDCVLKNRGPTSDDVLRSPRLSLGKVPLVGLILSQTTNLVLATASAGTKVVSTNLHVFIFR